METPDRPTAYTLPTAHHPTSPPVTPGTRSNGLLPPAMSETSTMYKRMGTMFTQSPPLDLIDPIDHVSLGLSAQFTSSTSSSRRSSASDEACTTSPLVSDHDSDSDDDDSSKETEHSSEQRIKAGFTLEEYESDPGYDCDIEVLRPDHYDDTSDGSEDNILLDKLGGLRCESDSSDEDEQERKYRRKKKRWSAGIFKRSHSQSIEGDSSYSDNDILDDVDSSARRLRRRVRGPSNRSSFINEDRDFLTSNNILEVEEPDDEAVPHTPGPPSIPSDDGFRLDELPFWPVQENMELEIEFL